MSKRILVTGGAGFIGSHLVDRLVERGEEVVCLDDFNDFYDCQLKYRNVAPHLPRPNYQLVRGSICDPSILKLIFNRYSIKKVVHLAAQTGVRLSIEQPLLYGEVNVRGTLNLLEMAREHKVEQFIFASSSSVYGANQKVPFEEQDPISTPISPYAATKYAGELICYTYSHLYNIPTTCLRFFSVYGPRQRPDLAIHKFTKLIYDGQPIPVFGFGVSGRDYTYIDDIIQGILSALDKPFQFEVFNLGNSNFVWIYELVIYLKEILNREVTIESLDAQPGDMEVTCADITKAGAWLGYEPRTALKDGLKKFVEWFEQYYNL